MENYTKTIYDVKKNLDIILESLNDDRYTSGELVSDISLVEKQLADLIDTINNTVPVHSEPADNPRGRSYSRRERARNIRRKSKILRNTTGDVSVKHKGMLSKGKVHCSCALCRTKSSDSPHISRLREDARMKAMLEEYTDAESNV